MLRHQPNLRSLDQVLDRRSLGTSVRNTIIIGWLAASLSRMT